MCVRSPFAIRADEGEDRQIRPDWDSVTKAMSSFERMRPDCTSQLLISARRKFAANFILMAPLPINTNFRPSSKASFSSSSSLIVTTKVLLY
jgi:hypothetical protein